MAELVAKRVMRVNEIPAFVDDVIKAGSDICAVGHNKYVLGKFEEQEAAAEKLRCLDEKYGNRDFLKLEIVAHLRSRGRYLDPGSTATHWTEIRPWENSMPSHDVVVGRRIRTRRVWLEKSQQAAGEAIGVRFQRSHRDFSRIKDDKVRAQIASLVETLAYLGRR